MVLQGNGCIWHELKNDYWLYRGRTIFRTLRICIAFVLNKSKVIRFDKKVLIPIEMYLGILIFFSKNIVYIIKTVLFHEFKNVAFCHNLWS